jgi:iron complex outermembrane recepter protein
MRDIRNVPAIMRRKANWAGAVVLASAIGATTISSPAAAQSTMQTEAPAVKIDFSIPSLPLTEALIQFGRQANMQTSAEATVIADQHSTAVKGNMTWHEAITLLLSGTSLTYRVNGTMLSIEKQTAETRPATESTTLSPLNVIAESDYGYNSDVILSATNTLADTRDIPRTVEVINNEIITDTKARSVGDALQYVAGATRSSSASLNAFGDDFLFRGFPSGQNFATNGLMATRLNHPRDTVNVERIEVLKGPASLLYGEMQPGAIVNVVTKQPLDAFQATGGVEGGSHDFWRVTGDVTGPVSENGALKVRVNGAYNEGDSFIDDWHKEHRFVSGVASLDITEDTLLTFEGGYSYDDWSAFYNGVPASGMVVSNSNGKFDRDLNISEPDYDGTQRYAYSANTRLEHSFNDNLVLRGSLMWLENNYQQEEVLPWGLQGDERTLDRVAFGAHGQETDYVAQINLNAQVETGPFSHDILLGADYRRRNSNHSSGGDVIDPIDIFDPHYSNTDFPDLNLPKTIQQLDAWGIYAQDRIGITEDFQFLAGLRYSGSKLDSVRHQNGVSTKTARDDEAWTTDIGFVYQPIEELALYASRADGFQPQTGTTASGTPFEPEESVQYEVGAKLDFFDGALSTDLAFFHITKENAVTPDPGNPGESLAIGEQESRGIEFTVRGEILPGWNALVAYALTDTEITKDNSGLEGKRVRNIPTHSVSLATRYDFQQESLEGLSLLGSVIFASERSVDDEDTMSLPAQARLDLGVAYSLFDAVELNARVENVTGATLYDASDSEDAVYPGAPRTFMIGGRITY